MVPGIQGDVMAIKVEISVHNLDLTDRLQEYVTKKVSKLDRYLDRLEEAKGDLSYNKSARTAGHRRPGLPRGRIAERRRARARGADRSPQELPADPDGRGGGLRANGPDQ